MPKKRLPTAEFLANLRHNHHLTYAEIGARYGTNAAAIWRKMDRKGLVRRCRKYHRRFSPRFWERANTVMALIRSGCYTYPGLAEALHCSPSVVHSLVQRLIELDLVTAEPGRAATLRLADPKMGSLVVLVRRRADGALEAYRPGNLNGHFPKLP